MRSVSPQKRICFSAKALPRGELQPGVETLVLVFLYPRGHLLDGEAQTTAPRFKCSYTSAQHRRHENKGVRPIRHGVTHVQVFPLQFHVQPEEPALSFRSDASTAKRVVLNNWPREDCIDKRSPERKSPAREDFFF